MTSSLTTDKINPLATPKGVKYLCELCGKVALIQCRFCRVTYYCSKDHQHLDWVGVHEKICMLLVPLRIPPPVLGTEEERMRRDQDKITGQKALLDLTRMEAGKYMHLGKHELAIPPALQALRFAVDIHGPGSLEVVPSYLLLAEACTGLQRYQQAEEYLSHAKWSVLKQPSCPSALRSQLHRNLGKLYAAQGKTEEAIHHLSNDIYFSSLVHGPEHIATGSGYYYLGELFLSQKNLDAAFALHDKTAAIWNTYLRAVLSDEVYADAAGLDGAQAAEALKIIMKITDTRAEALGPSHPKTAAALQLLGLLHQYFGDDHKAGAYLRRALEVFSALAEGASGVVDPDEGDGGFSEYTQAIDDILATGLVSNAETDRAQQLGGGNIQGRDVGHNDDDDDDDEDEDDGPHQQDDGDDQ